MSGALSGSISVLDGSIVPTPASGSPSDPKHRSILLNRSTSHYPDYQPQAAEDIESVRRSSRNGSVSPGRVYHSSSRARSAGLRFDTLSKICEVLNCQPSALLEFRDDGDAMGRAPARACLEQTAPR